jgi:hypothetical protein
MDEFKMRPNDRVCIGPSALFLYKNTAHDDEASMPDSAEDPISFDFADNEVVEAEEAENEDLKKNQEELAKEAEASQKQALEDEKARMEDEKKNVQDDIQNMENEAESKKNGSEEEKK